MLLFFSGVVTGVRFAFPVAVAVVVVGVVVVDGVVVDGVVGGLEFDADKESRLLFVWSSVVNDALFFTTIGEHRGDVTFIPITLCLLGSTLCVIKLCVESLLSSDPNSLSIL